MPKKRENLVGPHFHGGSGTPLYQCWFNMHNRCGNPNTRGYRWYGAKGITVCDDWQTFPAFRDWALSNGWEKGLTIERKRADEGYGPENCTFITQRQQVLNQSRVLSNDEGKPWVHIAVENGINRCTYAYRVRAGWPVEKAATHPSRERPKPNL